MNDKENSVLRSNFEWFLDHYQEIFALCGVCYVVIVDKQIKHICHSVTGALRFVTKNGYKAGQYNIQFCNGDESGYTAYINKA